METVSAAIVVRPFGLVLTRLEVSVQWEFEWSSQFSRVWDGVWRRRLWDFVAELCRYLCNLSSQAV